MKNLFFKAALTAVLLFSGLAALAQNIEVKGTVNDPDGQPIIGAGVMVEGTTNGVITDFDGNYTISVPSNGALEFSALGYEPQTIAVNGKAVINVVLAESAMSLEGTVVTALGIKRAAKTIGYAATEVKTSDLLTANAVSPVASLQGKVAGVEINQSDGGLFGSTKIQIRGASTLSKNNQPIYVIDGVILDNATSNTGDADWDANINDYGNQLKNLNPDDFESLTVLKGAAATALYGSRGLNGAVVITTKSGRGTNGIGVSFSQTVGFDYVYDTPGIQSEYLSGFMPGRITYSDLYNTTGSRYSNGLYDYPTNSAGEYSMIENYQGWGLGWGAPAKNFAGKTAELFDGTMGALQTYPDRYKDAFKTGFNTNTNISISGGNDKTSFYTSASYKYAEGTTQNNTFDRTSFFVKAGHHITDNLIVDASFNFTTSTPRNAQTNIGEYFSNGEFMPEYNTKYYKDKYKGVHGGLAQSGYGDAYGNIPARSLWWSINENDYTQKETTIRPTIEITYNAFPWLNFKVGGNYNYYLIRGESKQLGSGYANQGGSYSLSQDTTTQLNFYYGANAQYQVNDDLEIHGFLRGEYFDQAAQYNSVGTSGGLIVPGQFFIGNSINTTLSASGRIYNTKTIASAVGAFGLGWRDQLFLDITGRNDWSSTLVYTNGTGNYSYFYPSLSGSWLVTETFKDNLPSWITFAKVRASLAQVGNDTTPYYINSGYSIRNMQFNNNENSVYAMELPSTIKSPNLKPEKKTSWEVGIDWRFFNNRVGIDATYYKENTRNQIMQISVPNVSGISSELVNAGNIQNAGFEIALNTTPVETKDWRWDVDFTYTRNRNKIISLHEDVANWIVLDGDPAYGNYRIGSVAKVGGAYGILMTDAKKALDEATGLPLIDGGYMNAYGGIRYYRSGTVEELGSMLPDFLGSLNTTLRYKNLAVRASFDARFGGYVASYNSLYGLAYGFSETSLKYREGMEWTSDYPESRGITYYDGFIPNGVFANDFQINGRTIPAAGKTYQELYDAGILEPAHMQASTYLTYNWSFFTMDEDWVKKLNYIALREITVSYTLPSKWASAIKARGLSVSATGRNLGYLLNTAPNHENPEAVRGTGASNFRMRSFSPYTRSFLFTINASF